MDPQGALSVGLGLNPLALEKTLYNLLMGSDQDAGSVVTNTKIERLDLLPANIDLAAAEVLLVGEVAREQALARVLQPLRRRYDFILIDCPPSLGLLTVNALTAADGVLVPLECEYFALRGMALLMDTISKIADRLNPNLEIVGVLATMYDARTVHGREVLGRVEEAFGDRVFRTVVGKTIRFAEAPVAGESILTYAGDSPGAAAYRELAKEVLAS
jgi:chromosome partitioning protein